MCSAGLWLMPPRSARTPSRPGRPGPASGRRGRRPTASARTEWPSALRGRLDQVDRPLGSNVDRLEPGQRPAGRSSTPSAAASSSTERRPARRSASLQRGLVGVAQVDGERGRAGDHVDEVGVQLDAPDGADLVAARARPASRAHERRRSRRRRSRRRGAWSIGVVPAWFDWPVIVSSFHEMPCTPVTAPIVMPSASSTGPCSMCSSTNACGGTARARQRPGVADARQLVAEAGAVDGRRTSSASSSGQPADVDEAAEHVGREAGALLVGEEGDGERAARSSTPCRSSVSITSRPASTPRLPS